MTIPFTKMHGAANDFVVIDQREGLLPAEARGLFARLCDRRRGVGADGVLLLEQASGYDFRMAYFNADGGRAEFCGNGARCLIRFALDLGLGANGVVSFATDSGDKLGRRADRGRVALEFGAVPDGDPVRIESAGRTFDGRLVVAGVPHFVVPVEAVGLARVDEVPLVEWARPLRSHPRFGAPGANIDFVAPLGGAHLAMRTYERGVEGETLACGSGAIASALWGLARGMPSRVTVRTAGGDELEVVFEGRAGARAATLIGPAEVAFTGVWQH